MRLGLIVAAAVALAGCSTTRVLPDIDTFGATVEAASARVSAIHAAGNLSAAYDAETDAWIVAQNALLDPEDCGASMGVEDLAAPPSCRLVVKRVAGDPPRLTPVEARPPDGGPGVRGRNALLLADALRGYAAALRALAASTAPAELAADFAAAAGAVRDLVVAVDEAGDGEGPSPETLAAVNAGTDLLGTVLSEAFELRRYRAVARIARSADEAVGLASLSLAQWRREDEAPAIDARFAALDAASEAQRNAALAGSADRLQRVAETRLAHREALAAQNGAEWTAFGAIGQTHAAILASLDRPASLDDLAAANARIAALARKVAAFIDATEAVGNR